jgi:hypothetical protein
VPAGKAVMNTHVSRSGKQGTPWKLSNVSCVCVCVDVRAMIRGGHPPAPILAGLSDGHGHTVTLSTSVIKKQISDSSTALYRIDHSCLRRN